MLLYRQLSATFVMLLVTKPQTVLCESKAEKDVATAKVMEKAVQEEVTLGEKVLNVLVEKVAVAVDKDKRAVKEIILILIISQLFVIFVRNQAILRKIAPTRRNLLVC